jgi:BirA family transcriptional regulator, biotin operon repressor / biotin---[acetyl-CoA-carboxylase] ligase
MFAVHNAAPNVDNTLAGLSRQLSAATDIPVQLLEHIDSTNQRLLSSADELPLHPQAPCALMALQQSAGRGRRGRSWTITDDAKPDGEARTHPAFLASLGIRCAVPVQSFSLLPLHIGVAVVQTLNQWGCAVQIKWPNDIVIATPQGSAKLGGILVETRSLANGEHAVVMGMGLNWHSAPALADKLTACVMQHLPQAAPQALEASAGLLTAMALAWQRCIDPVSDAATRHFASDFAQYDALFKHEITAIGADGEQQHGIAKGINAQGHLGLQLATGHMVWLHSGEVSVRSKVKVAP